MLQAIVVEELRPEPMNSVVRTIIFLVILAAIGWLIWRYYPIEVKAPEPAKVEETTPAPAAAPPAAEPAAPAEKAPEPLAEPADSAEPVPETPAEAPATTEEPATTP